LRKDKFGTAAGREQNVQGEEKNPNTNEGWQVESQLGRALKSKGDFLLFFTEA